MKDLRNKRKFNAILKYAARGAILFIGASLITMVYNHFFGGNFLLLIDIPTAWLNHFTGWDQAPASGFVNSASFAVIVNGFLGAILFMLIAGLWQFGLKGDYDKK